MPRRLQKQTTDHENTTAPQEMQKQNAPREFSRQHSQELAQLRENVINRQLLTRANYENRMQNLSEAHHNNRRALMDTRDTSVMTNQVSDLLERFESNQKNQLEQHREFEERIRNEQVQAVTVLQLSQQRELDKLEQSSAKAENDVNNFETDLHPQVEANRELELEELQITIDAQNQLLKDYQVRVANELERDEENLHKALFNQKQQVQPVEVLREILSEQEKRQNLLNDSYERAMHLTTHRQNASTVQFGDLDVYGDQRRLKSIYDDFDNRRSENEHITAWINLILSTTNPENERSFLREAPDDKQAYMDMVTLTTARDMAVIKTNMDNEVKRIQKQAAQEESISTELIQKLRDLLSIEGDFDRTKAARERTIEKRLLEGKTVEDLLLSTDEKILQAVSLQRSVVEELGRQDVAKFFRNQLISEAEIQSALDVLSKHEKAYRVDEDEL